MTNVHSPLHWRSESPLRTPIVTGTLASRSVATSNGNGNRNHASPPRATIALASAAAALAVFVTGALFETWLISLTRPSEGELTWISDLVLAITLGGVLYLWLYLRSTRAALVELERTQIVLDTQLALAAKIQRDLLPPLPTSRAGITWAVQLAAAGQIGGDYYDFADLNGSSRVVIVGDIAGKGVPAAMMLVYVRAVFRQAVRETDEPRAIAARLASALYAETRGESYLTCIIARVDEKRRCLTSTTAGHPPAVVTGGSFKHLASGGPPVGLWPQTAYEEQTTQLLADNRIIFVTDGITERMPANLEDMLARVDLSGSAEEVCTSVFQLSEGEGAAPPVAGWDDDRTVVVLAVD